MLEVQPESRPVHAGLCELPWPEQLVLLMVQGLTRMHQWQRWCLVEEGSSAGSGCGGSGGADGADGAGSGAGPAVNRGTGSGGDACGARVGAGVGPAVDANITAATQCCGGVLPCWLRGMRAAPCVPCQTLVYLQDSTWTWSRLLKMQLSGLEVLTGGACVMCSNIVRSIKSECEAPSEIPASMCY